MKAERPFIQIRELIRTTNRENRDLFKYVFEKSDNISLWVIGLSISGISIFANNIANIQKTIPPFYLHPILLLLTVSVATGIIYRMCFLYFFVVLDSTQRGIDIALSNLTSMDTQSQLNGNESFPELVEKIKNNFGDSSYLILAYNLLDEKDRSALYQSVVSNYVLSVDFAQKDTENVMDFIGDTYSKFTGINKNKFLKKIKYHNAGKQYKWTLILTSCFYFVYIVSFISALFLFVCAV